jgi:hypothetical protein
MVKKILIPVLFLVFLTTACASTGGYRYALRDNAYAGQFCPAEGMTSATFYNEDGKELESWQPDPQTSPASGNHCYEAPILAVFVNCEGANCDLMGDDLCVWNGKAFKPRFMSAQNVMVCPKTDAQEIQERAEAASKAPEFGGYDFD